MIGYSEHMDDLRFTCVPGCTNCCDQEGYVYITEQDLERIAKYLKISSAAFEKKYVYRSKYALRLRKPPAAQCHFLEGGRCQVHAVKPVQCRTFPFWPELIENRSNWNDAAKYCPGIGTGPLVQIGTALEIAREMRTAYPEMYEDAG